MLYAKCFMLNALFGAKGGGGVKVSPRTVCCCQRTLFLFCHDNFFPPFLKILDVLRHLCFCFDMIFPAFMENFATTFSRHFDNFRRFWTTLFLFWNDDDFLTTLDVLDVLRWLCFCFVYYAVQSSSRPYKTLSPFLGCVCVCKSHS